MQSHSNVQKPDYVSVRDAFAHEAHDFTRWLEENMEALSARIGVELTVLEREKSVGEFSVDLLCITSDGHYAIVENQLEKSDHAHLGKVLTYMVNLEAFTAIWVTPKARPEHQRVIDWLNESTSADYAFYLVQVEAIRIGNSPYAPIFTILTAPDKQTRDIGETKKELADNESHRREFWTQLLERSKGRTNLFATRNPTGKESRLETRLGISAILLQYSVFPDYAKAEIKLDFGEQQETKVIFDKLYAQKDEIEAEFGEPLEWQRTDNVRVSHIGKPIIGYGGLTTPPKWSELQDQMINAMIKLESIFRPKIKNLQM